MDVTQTFGGTSSPRGLSLPRFGSLPQTVLRLDLFKVWQNFASHEKGKVLPSQKRQNCFCSKFLNKFTPSNNQIWIISTPKVTSEKVVVN